jgi:PhnB protein
MIKKDKQKAPVAGFLVVSNLDDAVKFYSKAFGAVESERYEDPRGKVWYAVIHIGGVPLQLMEPFRDMGLVAGSKKKKQNDSDMLSLTVADVDKTFTKAIQAGATSLVDPQHDAQTGVRFGELRDPFGHRWKLTQAVKGKGKGAKMKTQIEPVHIVRRLDEALRFQAAVFGAKLAQRFTHPQDKNLQAVVQIRGSHLRLMQPVKATRLGPRLASASDTSMVSVSVPNVDATYKKAMNAGAKSIIPPQDAYWGDRYAEFRDISGLRYACCGDKTLGGEVINPADLQKKFNNFLDDHGQPKSPAKVVGVTI